jgi:transcriptional regulator with XRE-family HTH domain
MAPPQSKPQPVYLVTRRRDRHWSQVELAERSGVSQAHISKLERRGDTPATPRTRRALALALGVEPEQLRFGPNPFATRAQLRERRRKITRRERIAALLDEILL